MFQHIDVADPPLGHNYQRGIDTSMHKAHKDGLKTCLSLAEGAAVALRRYLALMPLPDEQANAHLEVTSVLYDGRLLGSSVLIRFAHSQFVDTLLSRLVDRIGAVKVPLPPPHLAPPSAFLPLPACPYTKGQWHAELPCRCREIAESR